MNRVTLLGVAGLAASLVAVPVYAQNAGGTTAAGNGGAANNPSSYTNGGNTAAGAGATDNAGTGADNAALVGNGHYANVGFGSYSAEQTYITNNNGNNGGNGGGNNGGNNANNNNNWRPAQRNPVLADNGDARASKVVGTAVYNANNQKLGSIDDILIGTNGVWAVISTNNKQVAVKFGDLMFGNASNMGDDKIVIPQETQARLNTLPAFHYDVTNYQGVNANNFGANNFAANAGAPGAPGAGDNNTSGGGMGAGGTVGGNGVGAGTGTGNNR